MNTNNQSTRCAQRITHVPSHHLSFYVCLRENESRHIFKSLCFRDFVLAKLCDYLQTQLAFSNFHSHFASVRELNSSPVHIHSENLSMRVEFEGTRNILRMRMQNLAHCWLVFRVQYLANIVSILEHRLSFRFFM